MSNKTHRVQNTNREQTRLPKYNASIANDCRSRPALRRLRLRPRLLLLLLLHLRMPCYTGHLLRHAPSRTLGHLPIRLRDLHLAHALIIVVLREHLRVRHRDLRRHPSRVLRLRVLVLGVLRVRVLGVRRGVALLPRLLGCKLLAHVKIRLLLVM